MARRTSLLGEILVELGSLSERELSVAIAGQRKGSERIGETLVRLGYIDRTQLWTALAEQSRRWAAGTIGLTLACLQPVSVAARTMTTEMSVSVMVENTATVAVAHAAAANTTVALVCTSPSPVRVVAEQGQIIASNSVGALGPAYVPTSRSDGPRALSCGSATTTAIATPAKAGLAYNIEISY